MEISQEYNKKTKSGKSLTMVVKLQGECPNKEEIQETLHFIAQKSKQFYLKAGNEINNKLS